MRFVPPAARKLFIPEKGYVLVELDKKRADAQVVGKESNDETLLSAFRNNVDIYTENAKWLYGKTNITKNEYQWNKNGVHAIDYCCKENTLATTLHCSRSRAADFSQRWFGQHPGIRSWHKEIHEKLVRTGFVHNVWGFRKVYTDRIETTLPQATAWIASSTVSIDINKGMRAVYYAFPWVILSMQIHDSFILQVPFHKFPDAVPKLLEVAEVDIPYKPEPLRIPLSAKASSKSWGDVVDWKEAN